MTSFRSVVSIIGAAAALGGCAGYDKWGETTNKSISDSYTAMVMGKQTLEIDPSVPSGFVVHLAYRLGEGRGLPGRGTSAFYNKLEGDVTYAKSCKFLRFNVLIFNQDNALLQTEPVIFASYDAGVRTLINKDVLTDPGKGASSNVGRLLVKDVQCI